MLPIELNPSEYGLSNPSGASSMTFFPAQEDADMNHSVEVRICFETETSRSANLPTTAYYHPLEDPSLEITRRKASLTKAE